MMKMIEKEMKVDKESKNLYFSPSFQALINLRKLKTYDDMINIKINSRIMVQEGKNTSKIVRCLACNATLTEDDAVQNYDDNIVMREYEPQDKEALMTSYCEILRKVEGINKDILGKDPSKEDKEKEDDNHVSKKRNMSGAILEFIKLQS